MSGTTCARSGSPRSPSSCCVGARGRARPAREAGRGPGPRAGRRPRPSQAEQRGPRRAGEGQAGRPGARQRQGLDARRVRPEQPLPPAQGHDQEGRRERAQTPVPRPASQGSPGAGSTGAPVRPAASAAARATGGGGTHRRHRWRRHGGGTTTTTTVYKYVVDVTFTANGHTRHIKGMEKLDMLPSQVHAAADLHGRDPEGPATRCSSWTRRSRPPARASASRAQAECAFLYIGAGSEHSSRRGRRLLPLQDRRDPQGQGRRRPRRERERREERHAPRAVTSAAPAASSRRSWPTS